MQAHTLSSLHPSGTPRDSLTPPPADSPACSGAQGVRSSIERGFPLVLEQDIVGGPCRLHSDCLLSTGEEVDDLVDLLRGKDFRVREISLNLSDRMEPSVLTRLLAAVDAHPELRYLALRVNGSDTVPMPAPWREALAASYAFLGKGGEWARHRLFDEALRDLSTVFQGESWHIVRMELDAFLDYGIGRARLISGMALLMKDGVLLRAIATLSAQQRILINEDLPYMAKGRVLDLSFVDESLRALGLSYHLELHIRDAPSFKKLMEWLSSPRACCQAISVSFDSSTQAGNWAGLEAALIGQTSLRLVSLADARGKEIRWHVDPASDGGRVLVGLSVCLNSGKFDKEAMTALLEGLQPTHVTLEGKTPEEIASVLACVNEPRAVSTLTLSWRKAGKEFGELALQLRRFGYATIFVRVAKARWDGVRAQWSSAIEAVRPFWADGFTFVNLTDKPGPGFSIPWPAKSAFWEKGMQYFFAEHFELPLEMSQSRYEQKSDGLTLNDCRVLTQVSQAVHVKAAEFIRKERAKAVAKGLQDRSIDRFMLEHLLTDSSGQVNQELKDEVLKLVPALGGLTLTDH